MARSDAAWIADILSAIADIRADTAGMDLATQHQNYHDFVSNRVHHAPVADTKAVVAVRQSLDVWRLPRVEGEPNKSAPDVRSRVGGSSPSSALWAPGRNVSRQVIYRPDPRSVGSSDRFEY